MKFKIYFENVEIELPLSPINKEIEKSLDELKYSFGKLVENKKVLEIFNLQLNYGAEKV